MLGIANSRPGGGVGVVPRARRALSPYMAGPGRTTCDVQGIMTRAGLGEGDYPGGWWRWDGDSETARGTHTCFNFASIGHYIFVLC